MKSLFEEEALKAMSTPPRPWYLTLFGAILGVTIITGISLAVIIPMTIYNIFAYGFVAIHLWQWFVVPTFHLAPLSILQASGLIILIKLVVYQHYSSCNNKDEDWKQKIAVAIGLSLMPWFTLFIGYCIHRAM